MARSIATVWVPVDDMRRAVAFYARTLRLELRSEGEDWSEIDAGNLTIGLNAREGTAAGAGGGAVITFDPDGGIDAEVERLAAVGVEFPGGISDHPWGRIAPFRDTEGNDLQLYSPPERLRRRWSDGGSGGASGGGIPENQHQCPFRTAERGGDSERVRLLPRSQTRSRTPGWPVGSGVHPRARRRSRCPHAYASAVVAGCT